MKTDDHKQQSVDLRIELAGQFKRSNRKRLVQWLNEANFALQPGKDIRNFDGPWIVSVDNPAKSEILTDKTVIEGRFVLARKFDQVALRMITPKGKEHVEYQHAPIDVKQRVGRLHSEQLELYSFSAKTLPGRFGVYTVQICLNGQSWRNVCRLNLSFALNPGYKDLYHRDLAKNLIEHRLMTRARKQYYHEPEANFSIRKDATRPKLVSFFLPQFHAIPENDTWWGKGFTEWTNVGSAQPRFVGHDQPRLPADLGYYDLSNPVVLKKQIDLAKAHGVDAFCFYYYWFSGQRLLKTPLDSMVNNKDWDFNYLLCWANENWTKRWDGQNKEVLIEQKNQPADALNFIKDVEPILRDKRYLTTDGKPILLVYRPKDLPDTSRYIATWRQYFRQRHNQELYLLAIQSFDRINYRKYGFDGQVEFTPTGFSREIGPLPELDVSQKLLDPTFSGTVYDYRKIASRYIKTGRKDQQSYRCIVPSWDNDARRKGKGTVYYGANPDIYGRLLRQAFTEARQLANRNKLIFLNAWNEWAEAAYIEPDQTYGHAYLNRTAEAVSLGGQSKGGSLYGIGINNGDRLAVVAHVYYPELWPAIVKALKRLGSIDYDLFVSLPTEQAEFATTIKSFKNAAHTFVLPNVGRDILPFLHIAGRLDDLGYRYILKLHTKKSMHLRNGKRWMPSILRDLIPAKRTQLNNILSSLKDGAGMIGSADHYIDQKVFAGGNRPYLTKLLGDNYDDVDLASTMDEGYGFFGGTMFWLNLKAIKPILDSFYGLEMFESEKGRIDGTFAHAMERFLCLVPQIDGWPVMTVKAGQLETAKPGAAKTQYDFADAASG